MIEYGYISRSVSDPNKYRQIRDKRLELKRKKDPMQLPYKIVLNSTYGAMKDQYNPLYDPLMANNVCIAGQLLLLDLIEQLEDHCELIQSNTDGLFIKLNQENEIDKIKAICKEWEQRTRLELEFDTFERIYQKDVNNYIVIQKDGSYKSKGAYVKKLSKLDNDLPIVNKAVVNYFTNNIPVEKTIMECKSLIEFQKVVKVSNKYKAAYHGMSKLNEKVLRVFASRNESDLGVFKVKHCGRVEKMANTPEHAFIENGDITKRRIPRKLDRQYYINIANKRILDFIGGN